MSRKSSYLQMLADKEAWGRTCSNAAWDCASQLMFDAMSCVLTDPERDYYEEVLDRRVRAVYGPETVPFSERYPVLKGHDYTTAPNFAK